MNITQAVELLAEQGLIVRGTTDGRIVGGKRMEHWDSVDIDIITDGGFSIRLVDQWWVAVFGNSAIAQINRELSVAVQSICNVFKTDEQNLLGFYQQIPKSLGILQENRLPVLLVDYAVLEMYQPPTMPLGLNRKYGYFLTDWWLPTDNVSQPIGQICLKNNKWIIKRPHQEETIILESLEDAAQKAIEIFGGQPPNN